MEQNKNQGGKLNIELPEDVAGGTYSNLAIISHSHTEFIVDFIQAVPGAPKAKVKSRVIIPPAHAKRLLYALKENIAKYETAFGEIEIPEQSPQNPYPHQFGGPAGIA